MKLGRSWGTCNILWYPNGQNLWDTELIDSIAVDEDGYPLELPFETDHPNADTSQAVFSVWTNTLSLPQGSYILLYDGEGEFDFDFDAEITSQIPARQCLRRTPRDFGRSHRFRCDTVMASVSRSHSILYLLL